MAHLVRIVNYNPQRLYAAIPVVTTAAVGRRKVRRIATRRVWHYERRHGAISSKPANEFCVACVDCRGEICVLRGLARLELEGLVLGLKRCDFVLSEEVENRICAVALRVYNVTGRVVDCVCDVTSALREIVVHALNCGLRLAAAVLEVEPEVGNARVDAVKSLTQSLLDARLTEFKVVEAVQDGTVVEADSHVVGRCEFADVIAKLGISAAEAVSAPTIVAPAEEQQDKNPRPVASEEAIAVAVAVGGVTTCEVAAHKAVIIFVHTISLLFCLFNMRARYIFRCVIWL